MSAKHRLPAQYGTPCVHRPRVMIPRLWVQVKSDAMSGAHHMKHVHVTILGSLISSSRMYTACMGLPATSTLLQQIARGQAPGPSLSVNFGAATVGVGPYSGHGNQRRGRLGVQWPAWPKAEGEERGEEGCGDRQRRAHSKLSLPGLDRRIGRVGSLATA